MKCALILITLASLLAACETAKPRPDATKAEPTISTNLYLDDIAYPNDGAAFAEAFALEGTCRGLTLTRHTGTTNEIKMAALGGSHWFALYSCDRFMGCNGQISFMSTSGKPGTNVSYHAESPDAAVMKVCAIMKGVGGTVR